MIDLGALVIRPAVSGDAQAICTIYNQGIEDRVATLETEFRTAQERRDWLENRGPRIPVVVAEVDARVLAGPASTASTRVPRTTSLPISPSTSSARSAAAAWVAVYSRAW